jgi:hypothetical protein
VLAECRVDLDGAQKFEGRQVRCNDKIIFLFLNVACASSKAARTVGINVQLMFGRKGANGESR